MQPDTALIEAANEVVGPLAAMVPLSKQCATYFATDTGIASHIGNLPNLVIALSQCKQNSRTAQNLRAMRLRCYTTC